ncbi:ABC transporter ATP-binding protein/permease [Acidiphilium acidophilum]|uniref:ABC transporter ATP-binding protein/permease n=1 Tax=Acidiphilium acidophilum TaxID=76588 RepID=A0AAW9DPR3_ACIAO|nr:ABC transporter ATP-binding protein/permease [Acidiphilium acidophilum]MDX5930408.1 ABC transporter ATP-binding protein/permease [Acidiphilium acidophilum]GBQ30328.1 putative ABC transporter ATP-binding protein [Acidiphilium acidophilum DSM 700]
MKFLRAIGAAMRDAFRLAKPYFKSEEKWVAWGLLSTIIALNLIAVYLNVVYSYWYKIFYNALQTKDEPAFWTMLLTYKSVKGYPWFVPGFLGIAVFNIVVGVYSFYLQQMLEIRWRRWITDRFTAEWLTGRAHYQISLMATAGSVLDNPDQRIADDLRSFVSNNLSLGISFIANIVNLFSFIFVLWFLVPPLHLFGVVIPGYLVWVAILYSVIGTYLTHVIGWRLIPLSFQQQQVDADFRFNLIRVRENSEQIALYAGEPEETVALKQRFHAIYLNWWRIMKRTKALNFFTIGFSQVASIFPMLIAAPGYFAGIYTLGLLMQINNIFSNVQGSFSWFVGAYPQLVGWRATVQRLDGFERAVATAHARYAAELASNPRRGSELVVDDLSLDLPDGRHLLDAHHLTITPGTPLAITGASGSGKSTLFRALAGIWPFGRGRITRPAGLTMFLPQKPYFPLGSLKRAVAYPRQEYDVADESVRAALADVGLGALGGQLEHVDNWTLRLSGGEQQRLALARALIARPDWLFLDEALSALDSAAASTLFAMLRDRLPATQIVSISHQNDIIGLHPRRARVGPDRDGAMQVIEETG